MSAATAVALAAEASPAEDLDDGPVPSDAFVVDLDGWEGPLDLLLALARAQKVDLRRISIVALADQYLAYVAAARRASLELAAEYLVMAAWLAELKSRLLLPEPPAADEPSSDEMAAALAFQLRRMDAMREAGKRLLARPQLGRDFWQRGRPEAIPERLEVVVSADLNGLLQAYGRHLRRRRGEAPLALVEPVALDSVEAALARIRNSLGQAPGWESLARYLPEGALAGLREGSLAARSALAATFGAVLELARQGVLVLRQNQPFGPIYLKPGNQEGERR
ncbi:MAG: ScpA family protein [Rhodospirillales bacterium]